MRKLMRGLPLMLLGAGIGVVFGIGLGLAWTVLGGASGFEGHSAYVVAAHAAIFGLAGLLAGLVVRLGR